MTQPTSAHSQVGKADADPAVAGAACDAKIRPFPNSTEVTCDRADTAHDEHRGVIRDYAYPGSETVLTWLESDRRTFRGEWRSCDRWPSGCVLPRNHRGGHEQ